MIVRSLWTDILTFERYIALFFRRNWTIGSSHENLQTKLMEQLPKRRISILQKNVYPFSYIHRGSSQSNIAFHTRRVADCKKHKNHDPRRTTKPPSHLEQRTSHFENLPNCEPIESEQLQRSRWPRKIHFSVTNATLDALYRGIWKEQPPVIQLEGSAPSEVHCYIKHYVHVPRNAE